MKEHILSNLESSFKNELVQMGFAYRNANEIVTYRQVMENFSDNELLILMGTCHAIQAMNKKFMAIPG